MPWSRCREGFFIQHSVAKMSHAHMTQTLTRWLALLRTERTSKNKIRLVFLFAAAAAATAGVDVLQALSIPIINIRITCEVKFCHRAPPLGENLASSRATATVSAAQLGPRRCLDCCCRWFQGDHLMLIAVGNFTTLSNRSIQPAAAESRAVTQY